MDRGGKGNRIIIETTVRGLIPLNPVKTVRSGGDVKEGDLTSFGRGTQEEKGAENDPSALPPCLKKRRKRKRTVGFTERRFSKSAEGILLAARGGARPALSGLGRSSSKRN